MGCKGFKLHGRVSMIMSTECPYCDILVSTVCCLGTTDSLVYLMVSTLSKSSRFRDFTGVIALFENLDIAIFRYVKKHYKTRDLSKLKINKFVINCTQLRVRRS